MATLIELSAHILHKLDPLLDEGEREVRTIYASDRFRDWVEKTLPGLGSSWNIELTPEEQFDALACVFCSGAVLTFKWQFRPIRHIADGIWELKTADLRVFGWFPRQDCFIAVVADTTERVKRHRLYHGYAGTVARYRDALELDEPKFVAGDDPNAVVSNYSYP